MMTTVTFAHRAFDNRVTRDLGVEIPIVQAPMGRIARSHLASAVSRTGARVASLVYDAAVTRVATSTACVHCRADTIGGHSERWRSPVERASLLRR